MFWKRVKTSVIKPDHLAAELAAGRVPIIVDVRSPKEFQAGHLPAAINIPLEDLEKRNAELDEKKSTVFY